MIPQKKRTRQSKKKNHTFRPATKLQKKIIITINFPKFTRPRNPEINLCDAENSGDIYAKNVTIGSFQPDCCYIYNRERENHFAIS